MSRIHNIAFLIGRVIVGGFFLMNQLRINLASTSSIV
jgi:hypothetical protein